MFYSIATGEIDISGISLEDVTGMQSKVDKHTITNS